MTDPAPQDAESPLRTPLFRTLWSCNIGSSLGAMITGVAASWLMTSLTSSSEMVALVQAAVSAPVVVFSLWAGAMADNLDRTIIIRLAQGLTMAITAVLALLAWRQLLTPWLLLMLTFLGGSGLAIATAAWQASLGDIVERRQVPQAVALNSMGINVARSLGPTLGGAIVALAGPAVAFVVNAACALPLLIAVGAARGTQPSRVIARERIGTAMVAGLRYVARSRSICIVAARSLLFGVFAAAAPALLPIVARDVLKGGAFLYGFLLGSFGVGAVLGALVSSRLRRACSAEGLYRVSSLANAAGLLLAAAFASLAVSMPAMILAGAGWTLTFASFNISVQMQSPRWIVGRAVAIFQALTYAGIAGGSWLAGRAATAAGPREALLLAGLALLLLVLPGMRWRLPEMGGSDVEPLNSWQEPETAFAIEQRSGPVAIAIEHRIRRENASTFLHLMIERRRIKLRDGASRWSLLRDVADHELWIERYQLPTWLDYIRLNARRTQADASSEAALRSIERFWPLPVRRMIESQPRALLDRLSGSTPT